MSIDQSPYPVPSRRSFLTGAAALLLAVPAAVRFGSLMPISSVGLEVISCAWTPIIHAGQLFSLPHPGRGLLNWRLMCGMIGGSPDGRTSLKINGQVPTPDTVRRILAHRQYIFRVDRDAPHRERLRVITPGGWA